MTRIRRGHRLRCRRGPLRRIGAIVRVARYSLIFTVRGARPAPRRVLIDGVQCPKLYESRKLNTAVYVLEFPELADHDEVGTPRLGHGRLETDRTHECRIESVDRNYVRATIPSYVPRPGDAGAPITQRGRVIGMLASYWTNDMLGMGPRLDVALERVLDYLRRTRSSTA
ncbi:hypothetical protein [Methanopyrus sp.]